MYWTTVNPPRGGVCHSSCSRRAAGHFALCRASLSTVRYRTNAAQSVLPTTKQETASGLRDSPYCRPTSLQSASPTWGKIDKLRWVDAVQPTCRGSEANPIPTTNGDRHGSGSLFRASAGVVGVIITVDSRFSKSGFYFQGLEKLRYLGGLSFQLGCLSVTVRVEPTG